ncbi:hypothetical protein GCM10012286_65500 [Streptomyces lasiicapitis]|uniref:Uncharacterized protein n=1 Tax=Streptomyces lasiicapitis TaxID=1923961 RepID=A0ABQ2MM43_9ACTN|nr:hypothetical protein GCM10012286_65500 [Streptomyces lasiicapitis]
MAIDPARALDGYLRAQLHSVPQSPPAPAPEPVRRPAAEGGAGRDSALAGPQPEAQAAPASRRRRGLLARVLPALHASARP